MPDLDRLWAGWRSEYVGGARVDTTDHDCVFCALLASDRPDSETNIVWRGADTFAALNAYPYGTGHMLIMPNRHVSELEDLTEDESQTLWRVTRDAVKAIRTAYKCDGVNLGVNLGAAAGAGIPGHLHVHALPRWSADTNFMTAVANARVLPEALGVTRVKLHDAWPDRT